MDLQQFFVFALASLMLNITPGVDMLYIATRSTSQGIKAGILSALGIALGCLVHIVAAVIGLSAIIANSATAFTIIKYAGAGYLIWLGIKSIISKNNSFTVATESAHISLRKLFFQGAVTNILNPKVALFFLAFLPQFIDNTHPVAPQILFLGTWFNVSGTLVNIGVAFIFGKVGASLTANRYFAKWQAKITGCILLLLGLRIAASSRK
jgi:threonine/homoserine/homoserine lactone efflux protein